MSPRKQEGIGALQPLLATAGGAALLFGGWLLAGLPLLWSAVAGLFGYGALWLVLSGLGKPVDARSASELFVDPELARKTVESGRAAAASIRTAARGLEPGSALSKRSQRLAELIEAVAADVEADPKDAPAAQAFLSYQAEAASRLIKVGVELAKRGGSSSQVAEAEVRLERTFDLLIRAFEKQLASLQEDNIAELQSEIEVLEESLSEAAPFDAELEKARGRDGRGQGGTLTG